MLSLLFLPPRGENSIANFDGGPWPDLPPLGFATDRVYRGIKNIKNHAGMDGIN